MGVYSVNESFGTGTFTGEVPSDLNFANEACEIVIEAMQNHSAIMEAIGVAELQHFEENGQEMIYEAGQVKAVFAKFVEFFKKLLAKVQDMFRKFMAMINQFTMADKEFAKKYEKELLKKTIKFDYKGFKFTHNGFESDDLDKALAAAKLYKATELESGGTLIDATDAKVVAIKKANEDAESTRETLRGAALGKTESFTGKEFTQKMFELLRSGEDSKDDITITSIREYLGKLTSSAQDQKDAKNAQKKAEDVIKEAIKTCENAEKGVKLDSVSSENQATFAAMTTSINFCKDYLSYVTQAYGAKLQALKDDSRQAKAICVAALRHNPAKNEGAEIGSGAGFLENVKLK